VDIAQGEKVEAELDHMIRRADERRRLTEGERPAEEMWAESCRAYEAKRRAERLFEWVSYHEEAAERALANGEAIAARHRAQIEALLGPGHNGHHTENGNGHRKGAP
jgi:hypothetical protein